MTCLLPCDEERLCWRLEPAVEDSDLDVDIVERVRVLIVEAFDRVRALLRGLPGLPCSSSSL